MLKNKFLIMLVIVFSFMSCGHKEKITYEYDIVNNTHNPIVKVCDYKNDTVAFFIDTGANFSTINNTYYKNNLEQFKVKYTKELTITTISGETTNETDIVTYIFDNKIKANFYAIDITQTVQALSKKNDALVIGVLGSDFFKKKDVVLDFKNNKMYITDYVKVNK